MLHAACHCGAVRIEIRNKPRSLTQCTCSICRRYGARWAYCTRKTARVCCEPGAVAAYSWGKKKLAFYHCTTCGCVTHYESIAGSENSRIAVNARMMSPADIDGVKLKTFDGADNWKYLEH